MEPLTHLRYAKRGTRRWLAPLIAAALALACTACGSSGGAGPGSGSLNFAVFNPFSGPSASFGPEEFPGCAPAVKSIVAAGGILSHPQVGCQTSDSRGDPADAVPAAQQLVASTSNLVGIIGPSSDEASATVPIFNRSSIPMFSDTGQAQFDKTSLRYFWRITPPDDAVGYAMAKYAHDRGYQRVAAVFGNDISSQGTAPAVIHGFANLGGTLSINQTIALDKSSYRSEVANVANTRPQAIFIEADPQTSATYLTELSQIYHLVPIIGSNGTVQPPWLKAVSQALGAKLFATYYVGSQPFTPTTGPAHTAWIAQLHAAASGVQQPAKQWESDPYAQSVWDSVNIMALAMELAKSTNPKVYNAYIPKVVNDTAGAVVVHDFASGKHAILARHPIRYVGATGPVALDQYHNSPGGFAIVRADGSTVKVYDAAQLQAVAH